MRLLVFTLRQMPFLPLTQEWNDVRADVIFAKIPSGWSVGGMPPCPKTPMRSYQVPYPSLAPPLIRPRFPKSPALGGFRPYEREWWHFTLRHEPTPDTYFDIPVR